MRRAAVLALLGALALSACTGMDENGSTVSATVGDIDDVVVGPSDTLAPSIEWPAGENFTRAQSTVVWEGTGAPLTAGQPLLLDMFIESMDSGEVLKNTYDGLPESTLLAPELLGDALYSILLEAHVGTRVLLVSPPVSEFEGEPAIAVVVDVLSDRAEGDLVDQNTSLPTVRSSATGEPEVTIDPNDPMPTELTIATLIQGAGAQIQPGSYIVAQFKAIHVADGAKDDVTWSAGDVRQSTWAPEQEPLYGQVGTGKLLRAWDEGLIDQTAGSRVMLVVPEEWGYPGEGTVIFVIDILDVWNPLPEDEIPADISASPSPTPSPTPGATP